MADKKTNSDDLKSLMEKNTLRGPGICKIIIRNQTPPDWQVTILEVGTKFFYRDGSDFVDGPISVNLPTGGETHTENNDPSKCVFQEQTFMKIVVPGQPPAIIQGTGACPAGQCLIGFSHTLVPKPSVLENDLNSKDITKFLELQTN